VKLVVDVEAEVGAVELAAVARAEAHTQERAADVEDEVHAGELDTDVEAEAGAVELAAAVKADAHTNSLPSVEDEAGAEELDADVKP
jgi:uncharacterized low-complexity protein